MMADTVFPGESAIGRRLKLTSFDQNAPWYTVVGVVGDTRHTALDSRRPAAGVRAPQRRAVGADDRGAADEGRPGGLRVGGARRGARARPEPAGRPDPDDDGRRLGRRRPAAFHDVSRRRLCRAGARAVARRPLCGGLVFGRRAHAGAGPALCPRRDAGQPARAGACPTASSSSASASASGWPVAFVLARFLETQLFGVTAHDPVTFVCRPAVLGRHPRLPHSRPPRDEIDPMTALRTQ